MSQKTRLATLAGVTVALAVSAALAFPFVSVAQPLPAGWLAVGEAQSLKASAGTPRLPSSVTSDDGATVRITDAARVIVGGDDVIGIMEALGLGSRVFAAPESSVTAAGRKAPHHFLFNRTTGAEGVLSLDGTLFIGNSLRRHAKLSETLRQTGLPAIVIDDLQPAPQKIRKTANAFGLKTEGETLARDLERQYREAAAIARELPRRARVIHISATGGGGRPTVGGKDTAAANLIRLAGGTNIGDDAKTGDYTALSNEGMVAAAPEIVLLTRSDLELFGGDAGIWRSYPALKQTPAGQKNQIWVMPDEQLKIVGVHSGAGALALTKALKAFTSK
ncbi:heme/hemin ABC transporter substrate-binding protein [Ottowia thiooxydans]|uniref:heme/hemin ABC transporter substrate-binding protein n=1 Tax=Ottowia thiooxydans TaxID=219182 RepID=UPI00040F1A35|nr:ABC transporter substrate-binding protein [Ottowia thiooxydans]